MHDNNTAGEEEEKKGCLNFSDDIPQAPTTKLICAIKGIS